MIVILALEMMQVIITIPVRILLQILKVILIIPVILVL